MKEPKINYLIDIDGTICEDIPNEQSYKMWYAKAFPGAAETINEFVRRGHTVTFFTSRTEDMRELTEQWLEGQGFRYHRLIMDKPRGGNYVWIDNLDVKFQKLDDPNYWLEASKRFQDIPKKDFWFDDQRFEEKCWECGEVKLCNQHIYCCNQTAVYVCEECECKK